MELLEALETIKNFCSDKEICQDCPMFDFCAEIFNHSPCTWRTDIDEIEKELKK